MMRFHAIRNEHRIKWHTGCCPCLMKISPSTASFRKLLNHCSQAISERRLFKILDQLEAAESRAEEQDAFHKLNQLISRDPRALNAYIRHHQLEAQLRQFANDAYLLAS